MKLSLSPLMFIIVMEIVSRKVNMRGSTGRMLCMEDLALVVEEVGGRCRKYWGSGRRHLGSMG